MEARTPHHKRKWDGRPRSYVPDDAHHLFALMLAAYANIQDQFSQSILLKCLHKFHLSLTHSQNHSHLSLHQLLPNALLALLPFLLQSRYPKIAACSLEIVGAAALSSFEVNEGIASNKEIISGLLTALMHHSKEVLMAACNAVLDLSTTSFGIKQLEESSAMKKLLSLFCQIATSHMKSDSFCNEEDAESSYSKITSMGDNLLLLVLEAMSTLINTSRAEHLERIPEELSVTTSFYLKKLWDELQGKGVNFKQERGNLYGNIQMHDLAEAIFRLGMNHGSHTTWTSCAVQRSIFGGEKSTFEHFMLNYWEESPILLRMTSKTVDVKDDIFTSLIHPFNTGSIDEIFISILGGLVSCPPIASDEICILDFLKEVKGGLGCPIVYGQDIRVVKTVELMSTLAEGNLKKELHLLEDGMDFSSVKSFDYTVGDHVQKCKEAFHDGYSIALRGMEFRSKSISAVAAGLEMLFVQPSVGANLYLTPTGSQGLDRHADDHCVFVCQLLGSKQWAVFPRSTVQLPRLYEPVNSLLDLEDENDSYRGKRYLLREGDVLYIPRGCPHEAHALLDDAESQSNGKTGFSLHMTFGIEVEPPFEWEGFVHVALHCWNQKKNLMACDTINSTFGILNAAFVNLLHVAIRLVGDHDPTFRKACLVTAFSLPLDSGGERALHALDMNQRTTFSYLINRVNQDSCFLEAFKIVEAAVHEKNDGPLQWMRWLRHLPLGVTNEKTDFINPLKAFEEFVLSYSGQTEAAAVTFTHLKTQFCAGIAFEEVCNSFEILLKEYKKTRKQYANGMLSLHRKN